MANMFVKIDGVKGSSNDDKHKEWIEVESMGQGMHLPFTGGRSGTGTASSGTAQLGEAVFTKQFDAASVKLMEYCLNATKVDKIEIHACRRINKKLEPYWEATIEAGFVTQVNQTFNENMEPVETFSINGVKWEWKYIIRDEKGNKKGDPKTTWDSKSQKE